MSTVVMQSLAYVQHSSPVPGAKLSVSGDLRLMQRTPLPHRGLHDVYNVSVRPCAPALADQAKRAVLEMGEKRGCDWMNENGTKMLFS